MFFTNDDDEIIKLSYVVAVEPIIGPADREQYDVQIAGGHHITIKESFKSRASFITEWQAV